MYCWKSYFSLAWKCWADIFQVSRDWYKPQKLKPAIPLASMALNLDHHDNRIYKWRIASISISIKCFFTQLFCQIFPNDSQNLCLIQGHYLGSDNSRIFCLYMPQAHVKACIHYFFYQIFIFSPNDSPSKTMKNVFYFI